MDLRNSINFKVGDLLVATRPDLNYILRRVFPNLIANKLVSVQPITGPIENIGIYNTNLKYINDLIKINFATIHRQTENKQLEFDF